MQIMISPNQAHTVLNGLQCLGMVQEPISTKVLYNIAYSRRKIEEFVREVGNLNASPSEAYRALAVAREAACRVYALRNQAGEPLIIDNNYQIDPEKKAEFAAEIAKINAEHDGERLNELERERQKARIEGMDRAMPVEIRPVSMDDLPERLPAMLMDGLLALLDGSENPYGVEGGVETPAAPKLASSDRTARLRRSK